MVTVTFRSHALHTSLVLLSLFTVGLAAIKCFQCNSAENPGCQDLSVNDTNSQYYKECTGNYEKHLPFCRKVVTEISNIEGSTRILRSCGWLHKKEKREDKCKKGDTDFIKKRHCECFSDACNGSSKLSSQLNLLTTSAIVFAVFRQLDVV